MISHLGGPQLQQGQQRLLFPSQDSQNLLAVAYSLYIFKSHEAHNLENF